MSEHCSICGEPCFGLHWIAWLVDGTRAHSLEHLCSESCVKRDERARWSAADEYHVAAGWTVLRFTGREIHRDADGCVAQVLRVAGGSA